MTTSEKPRTLFDAIVDQVKVDQEREFKRQADEAKVRELNEQRRPARGWWSQ